MRVIITTKYKTHPSGSNNGNVQARMVKLGGTRTVRYDQALSADENHLRAAEKLATDFGLTIDGDMWHLDDGGRGFQAVT